MASDARDLRLVQLARLLGRAREPLTAQEAAEEAAARPAAVAGALLAEAADNDDVISEEAALGYLEDRLATFAGIIDDLTAATIRQEFRRKLTAWR